MMFRDDLSIPFDRITYRDGQVLSALDLSDEQRRHERLRHLHNRYIHESWGISRGLEVRLADHGHAVEVDAGHAIDAAGRVILLSQPRKIAIPSVPEPHTLVLVVNYKEDCAFERHSSLVHSCAGASDTLHEEEPVFIWKQPYDVNMGMDVPLIQLLVHGRRVDLDRRVRPYVRPLVRPYIRSGKTESGQTAWREWRIEDQRYGTEIEVDTSEAGFHHTPLYFATLEGYFGYGDEGPSLSVFPPESFCFLTNASPEGFTFRVFTLPSPLETAGRGWRVSWGGIEPVVD